jgi:hypothetical protein
MQSPMSALSGDEQRALLDDLNYLNMREIKAFCNKHSIPYSISVETVDGGRRKTRDLDRKGVILNRIRHFLRTGDVLDATCFSVGVICWHDSPKRLQPGDRLFYGQYDKKSVAMVSLLEKLTGGRFKNGAIARILAREFWSKGIAPTFAEYARAWIKAQADQQRPNPEWALLSDRFKGEDTASWKERREVKVKQVLSVLDKLAVP